MPDEIICLMGPTASGKTDLACRLYETGRFELISVDSALIYREMDIGTAKPNKDELAAYPHHLINIINPDESYSVADFCNDVKKIIKDIRQRGRQPLLVGGTMMYVHALQNGLAELPESNPVIRHQIDEEFERFGLKVMHERLAKIDPKSAAKIHEHDRQRMQRAFEVWHMTHTPLSELQSRQKSTEQFKNIALFPQDRAWLHDRIARRFKQMLEQGLVDEVVAVQKRWQLTSSMPSMRMVGYRQTIEYLENGYSYDWLLEKGIVATRQLAKRQLTWLRHWPDIIFINPENNINIDKWLAFGA